MLFLSLCCIICLFVFFGMIFALCQLSFGIGWTAKLGRLFRCWDRRVEVIQAGWSWVTGLVGQSSKRISCLKSFHMFWCPRNSFVTSTVKDDVWKGFATKTCDHPFIIPLVTVTRRVAFHRIDSKKLSQQVGRSIVKVYLLLEKGGFSSSHFGQQ